MIDLATREKAAALWKKHHDAFEAMADAPEGISDAEYAALEKAENDLAKLIDAEDLQVMLDDDANPVCCPVCKAQLLEKDLERAKSKPLGANGRRSPIPARNYGPACGRTGPWSTSRAAYWAAPGCSRATLHVRSRLQHGMPLALPRQPH